MKAKSREKGFAMGKKIWSTVIYAGGLITMLGFGHFIGSVHAGVDFLRRTDEDRAKNRITIKFLPFEWGSITLENSKNGYFRVTCPDDQID